MMTKLTNGHMGIFLFSSTIGLLLLLLLVVPPQIIIVATGFFFGFEQNRSWETFTDSISRTLEAFFPFFNLQEDRGLGDMILRATMLPMVGLLFITLRRKLERRFRH